MSHVITVDVPTDDLIVLPWHTEDDTACFDPRSAYVEQFWLGILGPSAVWLLRRVATGFDHFPNGFEMPITGTAGALGLGVGGKHSPFNRTVTRLMQFHMARQEPYGIGVRRRVPPLNERQVSRLPAELRRAHQLWMESDDNAARRMREQHRARLVAASLCEAGDDAEEIERSLVQMGTSAAMAAAIAAEAYRP